MRGLLVVDDEEGIRRSLRKTLEKEGYTVHQAENGENAVRMVRENKIGYEVVISDFRMPGMTGLETLVAIEKINPEITRIILTGYATMDSAIESVNAGIDGFLTKPFDNSELKAKVREFNLRKRLKQFVSEPVYTAMRKEGASIQPQNRRVAILFCDIRGFSSLSRKLSPEAISQLLNTYYFSPLDNVIFENNGTLDKHIGDSIMGIFGAPIAYGDDVVKAVMSAVRMQEEMQRINKTLAAEGMSLSIGIGISTGEGMVGIFGSIRKKEYTVFGTSVNLASRLEHLAKSGEILLCEETAREVDTHFQMEEMTSVRIKGMDREMSVFKVLRPKDQEPAAVESSQFPKKK